MLAGAPARAKTTANTASTNKSLHRSRSGAIDRLPISYDTGGSGGAPPPAYLPPPPAAPTPKPWSPSPGPPDERTPAPPPTSSPPPPPAPPTSPFSSDPGYADATNREQLGLGNIGDQLKNLISQRIVAYGDPSLAGQAGFDLDPQAAAFARQNYLSGNGQIARLNKGHNQARTAIINALASHGIVFSGETGYQTGQADQAYGNNVYDAQQSALADILGYRNSAQSQRDSLHAATVAALESAFQNYATNPAAYGQVPTPPPPPAPPVTPTPPPAPPKAIVKALVNPYTTGQKRFG